jgi:hypothetical protein
MHRSAAASAGCVLVAVVVVALVEVNVARRE